MKYVVKLKTEQPEKFDREIHTNNFEAAETVMWSILKNLQEVTGSYSLELNRTENGHTFWKFEKNLE